MTSSVLTLRLFGKMEARIDKVPLGGLHLREGERLLAYLTLHHGAIISYRELAQQFWPAESSLHAEWGGGSFPSTRQAIFALRRALGEHAPRLASVGKGLLRFDLDSADVDVVAFQELAASEDSAAWRRALLLYRGPLLEGWLEKWAQEARARCQRSHDRLAAQLGANEGKREEGKREEGKREGGRKEEGQREEGQRDKGQGEEDKAQPSTLPPGVVGASVAEAEKTPLSPLDTEPDGGAVSLQSPFYIARPTDGEFGQAIARRDSIVLVKGTRQIGKTSLLARGLQHARQNGARVILTDFSTFTADTLASLDALYRMLAQDIAYQLDMEADPEADWKPGRSPNRNLERFLTDAALVETEAPLVWGLDEIDRLFAFPFGTEVFRLFRSWHNRRALDPNGPWSRLTLAMAYATEAHLFIQDINQSPFNVGTRLALQDFTREQVADLNARYGHPLPDGEAVQRLYDLLSGHPYLTRRALTEMRARGLDIEGLEAQAERSEGVFGDHLRRLLMSLAHNPELTEAIRGFLAGPFCASEDAFYRLRSAGLITGEAPEECRWRCSLYATYFKRHIK